MILLERHRARHRPSNQEYKQQHGYIRRATRGRSRIDLLRDIVEDGTYGQLKEKALDRTVWKRGLIEGVP